MKKRLLAAVVAGATVFSTVQVAQAAQAAEPVRAAAPAAAAGETGGAGEAVDGGTGAEKDPFIDGLDRYGKLDELNKLREEHPEWAESNGKVLSDPAKGSSTGGSSSNDTEKGKAAADWWSIAGSSVANDAENDYRIGTTWDILAGTGIAAVLVAVLGGFAGFLFNGGQIPGLPQIQLPGLPR